jgi:hypothetical protein
MNEQTRSILALQTRVMAEHNVPPNVLKKKLRDGKNGQSHSHTCNHGGGVGRKSRRVKSWRKHGMGPANVTNGRLTMKLKKRIERGAT